MKFLEIIFFSQYYELKKSGKDPQKGRLNGMLLSAVVIMLNLGSIIILLFKYAPQSSVIRSLKNIFSGYDGSGKAMGKLIGAILLAIIGGILWLTIGSEKSYNIIAEKYLQYPEVVQAKTVKRSLYMFLISFALFLILLFL